MCFAIALTTISQLRMELFKDKEVRIKKSFSAFVWRIPLTQLRTKKESFLLITKKFNKFQLYSNEHVLWLSINKIIISIQCMHGKFGKFIEKKIYGTLSENEIKQRIPLDWFWWCYILLLLQVFVEHVDRQWGVWYVADQVLEIVGVTRQTTNGIGLRFNKFLLQVVSDLIMISKKQSKIRNVQYSSVVGMYKNLESQKKKYS